MLIKTLIKRLRIIPVKAGKVSMKKKITFLAQLAGMGYEVEHDELYNNSVLADYDIIIETLKEMKGGNVDYVPLFLGFPNKVPEQDLHFCKRIMGFIGNDCMVFKKGHELENGITIPKWLFDLKDFGADPIMQFQDKGLFERAKAKLKKRKAAKTGVWTSLSFVEENEAIELAKQYLVNNLYAAASIKEAIKEDLEMLLNYFGSAIVDPSKVVFKETRTYIMKQLWTNKDFNVLANYIDTPTDLLRLFAALTETDTSLSDNIRFPKFKRSERRFILEMMEKATNLAEDIKRYEGLWLELGRYLHPGEYKTRFPQTYAAFDALRNGKLITFNSKVEAMISARNIKELVGLLKTRPGVFARRLHEVLEISDVNYQLVIEAFGAVVQKVTLKNLMILRSYFMTTNQSPYRTIINKKGKIRVMDNNTKRVRPVVLSLMIGLLEDAISLKISEEKDLWTNQKVWIDRALINYTVPLQQRKASDGLMTLGRGSKIPLEASKVLRLFVYWKQEKYRTDLDLSLIQYNSNMEYKGHVSYTNLKSGGIVHSGDITSAELGATEFIDIELATLKKQEDIRYIATQIYRYAGEKFTDMECISGWMLRDEVNKKYKSFDIKTVQNKFDLNGSGACAIPIIIDLRNDEIIFVDLYINGISQGNNVEGAYQDISIISKEMVKMNQTKPNMFDLATFNCKGRKAQIVDNKDAAELTIGLKDCDYNVSEVEKILAELT